jgi:hypothetical protein
MLLTASAQGLASPANIPEPTPGKRVKPIFLPPTGKPTVSRKKKKIKPFGKKTKSFSKSAAGPKAGPFWAVQT